MLLTHLPELAGAPLLMLMATQMPSIGPYLIVVELALVAGLVLARFRTALAAMVKWWPLLIVPILAALSALWSDAPMTSLRYGVQFLFTAFAGLLLAKTMNPQRFLSTINAAMFAFCVLCIFNGRTGPSAEGAVLIGLTGSKNQMGYAAQVLLLSGLASLMLRGLSAPQRWIAAASLPLGVYLLIAVEAATALLLAAGGVVMLIGLAIMERLPPGGRLAGLIGGALVLAPFVLLAPELAAWADSFVFDTLGKDPTLTGRTLLWARADDLVARQPVLGYGYQAIWIGDSTEAVALRRLTGQADGRAFHFHHQFRQVAVDTGFVGLGAFVIMLAGVGFAALRQTLLYPSVATSFFFVLLSLMVARAFTDTVIGPFNVHTVLFFAACVYAFWRPQPAPPGRT